MGMPPIPKKHQGGSTMKQFLSLKTVMALLIIAGFFMAAPVEAKMLKAPKQISPKNNSHFTHFPRKVMLRWTAVKGAIYDVEIDCLHCRQTGKWDSQTGPAWKVVKGLRTNHYSFNFVGDNRGRWRVRARAGFLKSNWTRWWYFDFKTSAAPQKMPDLIVRDIRLIKDCKIKVTLKNIGNGSIAETYYKNPKAVAVQMYKDGKPWGGLILDMFDKHRKLKNPGGMASWIWFPRASNLDLGAGKHKIRVVVDSHGNLAEKNEGNNELTRVLGCNKTGLQLGGLLLKNKIYDIHFSPVSPSALNYGDKVKIAFSYKIKSKMGAYIFARPMTKGKFTPHYSAHPSALLKGKGTAKGFFTIEKGGPVTVDHVRFRMMDKTRKKVIYEKIVPVKFSFPKFVTAIPGRITTPLFPAIKSVILDLRNTRLIYKRSTKTLQIAEDNKVLSYAQDWTKCNVGRSIIHLKEKFWSNFYWEINVATKKVYRVTNGSFCKGGGKKELLAINVSVSGDTVMLYLKGAHLVYTPKTKSIQIGAYGNVLSYGSDWQKCNQTSAMFHIKENFWKGFHWKIDASAKKAYLVNGGTFCKGGGSESPLNVGVRVIK